MNLSIIIPIYNKAEYISECLNGVFAQTLKDIEIICIDDGSTDGSAEIISEFAENDERIRLIKQNNRGAGAARNAGIKVAKGEYIAFLDADDYYPSNDTLARIYGAAKANNADICGGSFCEIFGDERKTQFGGVMLGNTFEAEGWVSFKDYQFDYGFYRFISVRINISETKQKRFVNTGGLYWHRQVKEKQHRIKEEKNVSFKNCGDK